VADYRAATPTAAVVALLPDREQLALGLSQRRLLLRQSLRHRLEQGQQRLQGLRQRLEQLHPQLLIQQRRQHVQQQRVLLQALSPQRLLQRGFALVLSPGGQIVRSVRQLKGGDRLHLELADGRIDAEVHQVHPQPSSGTAQTHG